MADYTRFTTVENDFIIANDGKKTDAEIAAFFIDEEGRQVRTPKAIENQRLRLRQKAKMVELSQELAGNRIVLPAPAKKQFVDQMNLDADNALIISDVHLPTQDKSFLENACNIALDWGIENVIIAGDLFNVDAFSAFVGNPQDLFDIELDHAERFIDPIATAFKKIKIFLGNHEARFFKQVLRQVSTERFGRMFLNATNVEMSSYEWMEMSNVDPESGACHDYPVAIIHPKNHSSIPGRIATFLADRRFTGYHVLTAHEHTFAWTRSSDGFRHAIAMGMTGDPLRCDYAQKSVSTLPRMMQGCVLWRSGKPYPFTPHMDASAVARMFAQNPLRIRAAS